MPDNMETTKIVFLKLYWIDKVSKAVIWDPIQKKPKHCSYSQSKNPSKQSSFTIKFPFPWCHHLKASTFNFMDINYPTHPDSPDLQKSNIVNNNPRNIEFYRQVSFAF